MTKINNYEYGLLSDKAYENPILGLPNAGYKRAEELGFKLIATSGPQEDETGYFAAAFERDGEIVIASRGTNPVSEVCKVEFSNLTSIAGFKKTTKDLSDCLDHFPKDGKSDLFLAFKTLPQERFSKALEFYNKIATIYGSDKISFTGHSLGGFDSNILAVHTGRPSVTFEAPGIKDIALEHYTKDQITRANITNYIGATNLINGVNEHLGKVIQLEYLDKTKVYEHSFVDFLSFTNDQHTISQIMTGFDKKTGDIIVPHKEVENHGGDVRQVCHHYSSYTKNQVMWDKTIKTQYENLSAVVKQTKTLEDYTAYFINDKLLQNDFAEDCSKLVKKVAKYAAKQSGFKQEGKSVIVHKEFDPKVATAHNEKLSSIADKMGRGEDISPVELAIGKSLAADFFSYMLLVNPTDSRFHYEFVTGKGAIGVSSNQALGSQKAFDDPSKHKVKIMLAYEHSGAAMITTDGKLPLGQAAAILENALDSQGFSSNLDIMPQALQFQFSVEKDFKLVKGKSKEAVAEKYKVDISRILSDNESDSESAKDHRYIILSKAPDEIMKGLGADMRAAIAPIKSKLDSGIRLSPAEEKAALRVVDQYYGYLGKLENGNYTSDFVVGKGELGALGNELLYQKCAAKFTGEAVSRCNNVKITLAAKDSEYRAANGTVPSSKSSEMRVEALKSQGLDGSFDLMETAKMLSSSAKEATSISELVDVIKSKTETAFKTNIDGMSTINLHGISAEIATSLVYMQSAIKSISGVNKENTGISMFARSREEAASIMGISPSLVQTKYAPNVFDGSKERVSEVSSGNIYQATLGVKGARPAQRGFNSPFRTDVEFLVKFVTSPISTAASVVGSILSGIVAPKPASVSATSVQKLHIKIGPC